MRTRGNTALGGVQREHVRPLPVSPESRAHPLGAALADGQKFSDAADQYLPIGDSGNSRTSYLVRSIPADQRGNRRGLATV